jgi:DNA polymerase delta subunit 2
MLILAIVLGCYPFQNDDPFILRACPHIFFAGNQPEFKTAVVEAESTFRLNGTDTDMPDAGNDNNKARVRLLSLPKFHETKELILVDTETLEVEVVRFDAFSGKQERQ